MRHPVKNANGKWIKADGSTSDTKVELEVTAGATGLTISNLPLGKYTITENEADAAVTGTTLEVTGDKEATITRTQLNPTATITNTYTDKKGSLKIVKTKAGATDRKSVV